MIYYNFVAENEETAADITVVCTHIIIPELGTEWNNIRILIDTSPSLVDCNGPACYCHLRTVVQREMFIKCLIAEADITDSLSYPNGHLNLENNIVGETNIIFRQDMWDW